MSALRASTPTSKSPDESGTDVLGASTSNSDVAGAHGSVLVSIILPTLNEEYIDASLERLTAHLLGLSRYRFELLLVDDSPEQRKEALRASASRRAHLAPRIALTVLEGPRKGKGAAVRVGAQFARGEFAFVLDADLPVPLEHIEQFLAALDGQDNEIVIGTRPMTRDLTRPVRLVLSRVLSLFVHVVVFQAVVYSDTQCGFKAFRTATLRSFAERQRVDGGMYDVEYLYVAGLEQRKVLCVPVIPEPETRPSKINVMKCIYSDPVSLVNIKVRGLFGRYGAQTARGTLRIPPA